MSDEKRQQDNTDRLDKLQNPGDLQRGMPVPKLERVPTPQPQPLKQPQQGNQGGSKK